MLSSFIHSVLTFFEGLGYWGIMLGLMIEISQVKLLLLGAGYGIQWKYSRGAQRITAYWAEWTHGICYTDIGGVLYFILLYFVIKMDKSVKILLLIKSRYKFRIIAVFIYINLQELYNTFPSTFIWISNHSIISFVYYLKRSDSLCIGSKNTILNRTPYRYLFHKWARNFWCIMFSA